MQNQKDRYLTFAVRFLVLGGPPLIVFFLVGLAWSNNLRYATGEEFEVVQPIPFSHRHHVQGLGIDCRFCHSSVDRSEHAGIPTASTCMECHSQIWSQSPTLEAVRKAYALGEPIRWKRVNELPDFVFFSHHQHVRNEKMSCENCHGEVETMPYSRKANAFNMQWCLDCHRQAEIYIENLRPSQKSKLLDCSTCHQ